jgi:hypothetical protein
MKSQEIIPELNNGEKTEFIFDEVCFGKPADPTCADDVNEAIARAIELDERPVFLEGVAGRLCQLGIKCTVSDTDIMLKEIKRRFKNILGKTCPRTVKEWFRGTTPGFTEHINNYDLCYALEMNYSQTTDFFQKNYLTLPWNCKNKTDAIFMYCLWHGKPYSTVRYMLDESKCFISQENAHTSTSQIMSDIVSFDDDEKFMRYLSCHCYENKQQFLTARLIIKEEVEKVKSVIRKSSAMEIISPDRLNSMTIEALLGYRYQSAESPRNKKHIYKLPKRFSESLPNDVTLGRILNDQTVSYETLRKTLIILKLFNFYHDAENDVDDIPANMLDFFDSLNPVLSHCGFARIYPSHPFDCLILYCTNSYDPLLTLSYINEIE